MGRLIDITGQRFGRLVVLKRVGSKDSHALWLCRCDCSKTAEVRSTKLKSGHTRSCGCLVTVHGKKGTPEYACYGAIIRRCYKEDSHQFFRYGGRGIEVCDRWRFGEDGKIGFQCFYEDMGDRPSTRHCIDRIDNDGNYEPGNCRWATQTLSSNNQRPPRKWSDLPVGVGRSIDGKFVGRIRQNGKLLHLGTFDTAEQASVIYQMARSKKLAQLTGG